jgi:solute carrier family 25 phosphate transporter 23/24/25/41
MWQRHQRRIRNGKSCRVQPVSNKSLFEGTASTTVAFAPVSKKEARQPEIAIGVIEQPRLNQLLKHPLAIISYVPRELALFAAGAVAGAAAKTVTAPLDRIKLLMQVCSSFPYRVLARVDIVGFERETCKGKDAVPADFYGL